MSLALPLQGDARSTTPAEDFVFMAHARDLPRFFGFLSLSFFLPYLLSGGVVLVGAVCVCRGGGVVGDIASGISFFHGGNGRLEIDTAGMNGWS